MQDKRRAAREQLLAVGVRLRGALLQRHTVA